MCSIAGVIAHKFDVIELGIVDKRLLSKKSTNSRCVIIIFCDDWIGYLIETASKITKEIKIGASFWKTGFTLLGTFDNALGISSGVAIRTDL